MYNEMEMNVKNFLETGKAKSDEIGIFDLRKKNIDRIKGVMKELESRYPNVKFEMGISSYRIVRKK